ncbi:hypothetical protein SCLCIDRAFT_142711 [Scleroderma citrinum Foug A]|uniref:NADH:flavin oxidoreductase/NADH oxidase N-terminal domain-containing protein n=1 Tax=Scleroderma citrinum Foug A TaxID=1036808 RepID=A0A0C2YPN6_9AGAM|nr:hypothetical protein SCLCIDRAFT_142711 [Scleroderma citrinum Foug A]
MTDPAVLGQSVTFPFSGKVAKNRVLKSAMSERLATFSPCDPKERGQPTEELIRLYETWATGGIGIIITGNIQIKKDHLEATGNAIIDKDLPSDYLEYYRTLARAAKTCGSLVLGQLSHPGRQVSLTIQSHPESASDIEHPSMAGVLFARPMPLTKEGIRDIVQRFAYAASVLHEARFDGIQLHAAHGYLLHQFLSLRTNKRTDEYGGVLLSNRARLLLEIIAEIKRAVNDPTFMVSVKLNCHDLSYPHDVSEEEPIALAKMLESAGVDLVEVSGGTYETPQSFEHDRNSHSQRSSQAYFIDFANRLRPYLLHTKICVTGGFRSASAMADAIRSGLTDVVGLARPLAAEPFLVAEMLNGTKSRAKEDKLPPGQILRIAAAAAQIAEIGNGYDITDFNSAFNVSRFVARLQKEIPATMSEAFAGGEAMSF